MIIRQPSPLTKDQARRIAANIAKLPELLKTGEIRHNAVRIRPRRYVPMVFPDELAA